MGKKIFIDLRVSADGIPNTDHADEYVPPAGSKVGVKMFWGSSPGLPNAAVVLAWDYDQAGEELLCSIKGQGAAPVNAIRLITAAETDGTKKIALYLTNSESGNILLSGYARLSVTLP